jgi:hypothetical protein
VSSVIVAGGSKSVHFRISIDQATIDAIYAANRCDLDIKIVNTFGEAHGS